MGKSKSKSGGGEKRPTQKNLWKRAFPEWRGTGNSGNSYGRNVRKTQRRRRRGMLDRYDFFEYVKNNIRDYLPPSYEDAEITITQIPKHNDAIQTSLTIKCPGKGSHRTSAWNHCMGCTGMDIPWTDAPAFLQMLLLNTA